jgi:hypothetical protein
MSEWLKEHAWKANLARLTERHRNTSSRKRFNDLRSQDAPRCDSVNAGIPRRFQAHLTQFLHRLHWYLTGPPLCERLSRAYAGIVPAGKGLASCEVDRHFWRARHTEFSTPESTFPITMSPGAGID